MVFWRQGTEGALAKVEVVASIVVVKVWVEAQETTQSHQEHQMEIGKVGCLTIEPLHTATNIVEERLVALFGM